MTLTNALCHLINTHAVKYTTPILITFLVFPAPPSKTDPIFFVVRDRLSTALRTGPSPNSNINSGKNDWKFRPKIPREYLIRLLTAPYAATTVPIPVPTPPKTPLNCACPSFSPFAARYLHASDPNAYAGKKNGRTGRKRRVLGWSCDKRLRLWWTKR